MNSSAFFKRYYLIREESSFSFFLPTRSHVLYIRLENRYFSITPTEQRKYVLLTLAKGLFMSALIKPHCALFVSLYLLWYLLLALIDCIYKMELAVGFKKQSQCRSAFIVHSLHGQQRGSLRRLWLPRLCFYYLSKHVNFFHLLFQGLFNFALLCFSF